MNIKTFFHRMLWIGCITLIFSAVYAGYPIQASAQLRSPQAPDAINLSNSSLNEHLPSGTLVGVFSTTGPGGPFIYSLVPGAGDEDNAAFSITGPQLFSAQEFDYETRSSYSIRVLSDDGLGTAEENSFQLTILDVNETPNAQNDSATVSEGGSTSTLDSTAASLLANDSDPDGDPLNLDTVPVSGPSNGAVSLVSNGTFLYSHNGSNTTSDSLVYRACDNRSPQLCDTATLSIAVIPVNDPPTDLTLSNTSIAENQSINTEVGVFSTVDADSVGPFAYSLVSGDGSSGNGSFTIDGDRLKTAAVFNYEAQSSYSIRVSTTDEDEGSFEKSFIINVTNLNEAPTNINLSSTTIAEDVPVGTTVGLFSTSDPDVGDSHTYSLVSGDGSSGNNAFTIDGNSLKSAIVFDYDVQNSYNIRVRSTDNGSLSIDKQFVITVVSVNHPPTNITLSNNTVAENQPDGTLVGTFSTSDPNAGDTHSYTIVGGDDLTAFMIDGNSLLTAATFNYELQNIYNIRVRSTDNLGLSFEKGFAINVLDVNEAPTNINLSSLSIAENQPAGTTVGTFTTSDPDAGSSHTYSLVEGTGSSGNSSFTIDGNSLKTAASFNFEAQSSYNIRVRTTDNGSLFFEKQFTISVTDVNELPTNIILSSVNVAENQPAGTTVGTFTTIDPDAGSSHTYTLVSGDGSSGNSSFTIDGNSLKTAASFNFEAQSSYNIRVRTTDNGTLFFEKQFIINVTDVNEAPTNIALSSTSVAENQPAGTTVGTFTTSDPDAGSSHTYSLVSGDGSSGNSSFTIDGNSLKTAASFNFEAQSSYNIRVRTTDNGTLFFEKQFTINVTDVNEAPTNIALPNASVAENQPVGTTVGTFTTSDPDTGGSHTYSLVEGTGSSGNSSFTIEGSSLKTAAAFDYEAQNTYNIRMRTTDNGGLFFEKTFVISVTDVNEAPTNISLSNTSVDEKISAGAIVGLFTALDSDAGETFSYLLVSGEGSQDNAAFSISGETLRTNAIFDYAVKNSYSIRVRVLDSGGLSFEKQFTIAVNNVNDPPEALGDSYLVDQGLTLNVTAPGVLKNDNDPDNDVLEAVLVTGPAHAAAFSLNSDGSFSYTPVASFTGLDSFTYRATDGALASQVVLVEITVRDITDPVVAWMEPVDEAGGIYDIERGIITLKVSAQDNEGIDRVRFYRWDALADNGNGLHVEIGLVTASPYQVEINVRDLNIGWNQVFVVAYDNQGNDSNRPFIWIYRLPPTFITYLPGIIVFHSNGS